MRQSVQEILKFYPLSCNIVIFKEEVKGLLGFQIY